MPKKPFTYIVHGPSGCGKDTQLDLLAKKISFERIGTGDMFRRTFEAGEPDGIEAHNFWGQGGFVPATLTFKMLNSWLKQYSETSNWIFVSAVRLADQISLMDELLGHFNRPLDSFIHFSLSEEKAIERLSLRTYCSKCGTTYHEIYKRPEVPGICNNDGTELIQREDDKPEFIKKRLEEYNANISPILDEYKKRGVLIDIDASSSIEEIFKNLCSALKI